MGIDTLYNLFLTALAAGIVIAGLSLYVTREEPRPFLALHFSNPKELPGERYSGQPLAFEASLEAKDGPLPNVSYTAAIEYYKLYDITEGTYNCLGKYHNKLFIHWVNRSSQAGEEIAPLVTAYTTEKAVNDIPWDQYHLEFGIQRLAGAGTLTVLFGRNESPYYRVGIDMAKRQVLWNGDPVAFNNTAVTSKGKVVELVDFGVSRGMDVHLFVKDGQVTLYLNGVLIFSKKYGRLLNGRFWFETEGMYANVMSPKIYRDTPIAVPDRGEVLDVVVNVELVLKGSRQVKAALATSVTLVGGFVEGFRPVPGDEGLFYAIDCGQPLCVSSRPDRAELGALQGNYLYYRLAYENYTGARSFVYAPRAGNPADSAVAWDAYRLSFKALPLTGPRKVAFIVGNSYAVELDVPNNRVRAFAREGSRVNESAKVLPGNLSASGDHGFEISVEGGVLHVTVDGVELDPLPISNATGLPLILFREGRGTISTIKVSNLAQACSDPAKVLSCEKSFKSKDQPQARTFPRTGITPTVEPVEELAPTEEVAVTPLQAPSTVLAFGGPEAALKDVEDYFFTFNYAALDGQRRILLLFESINGSKYELEIDEAAGIVAFTPVESLASARVQRFVSEREFGEPAWRNVRLDYMNGSVKFFLDDTFVFGFSGYDMDSGVFTLRLDETFGHFEGVYLRDRATNRRRDFAIRGNPCQLREVGRAVLQQGAGGLDQGKPLNLAFSTPLGENISSPFDFALVGIQAGSQKIHFWVTAQ